MGAHVRHYSSTGALVEWKRYRRDPDDKYRVLIDRYGSDDRVISVGEVERAGGPELSQAAAFVSLSNLFASGRRREFNGLY